MGYTPSDHLNDHIKGSEVRFLIDFGALDPPAREGASPAYEGVRCTLSISPLAHQVRLTKKKDKRSYQHHPSRKTTNLTSLSLLKRLPGKTHTHKPQTSTRLDSPADEAMETEAEVLPAINQETPEKITAALNRIRAVSGKEIDTPRTTLRVEKIPLHFTKPNVVKYLREVVKNCDNREEEVGVDFEKGPRYSTLKISGERDLTTIVVLLKLPVYFIQGNSYRIRHPETPNPANLGENRVLFALNMPADLSDYGALQAIAHWEERAQTTISFWHNAEETKNSNTFRMRLEFPTTAQRVSCATLTVGPGPIFWRNPQGRKGQSEETIPKLQTTGIYHAGGGPCRVPANKTSERQEKGKDKGGAKKAKHTEGRWGRMNKNK